MKHVEANRSKNTSFQKNPSTRKVKKIQTNISEDKIFGLVSVNRNSFFHTIISEKKRFDFIVFIHLVDFAGFAFCIF